jgi:hypothetical protein
LRIFSLNQACLTWSSVSNIDKFLIILNHSRDLLAFVNLTGVEPDIKRVLALVVVSSLVLV